MLNLLFHGFSTGPDIKWDAPFHTAKYTVDLHEARELILGLTHLTADARLAVTIDDCHHTVYTVGRPFIDLCHDIGIRVILFPTTGILDGVGCTRRQIEKMSTSGCEIGSHGHDHRPLTLRPLEEVLNDLLLSKQLLENVTSRAVDLLSVPGGFCNRDVLEIAQDLGFTRVYTSRPGLDRTKTLVAPRIVVRRKHSLHHLVGLAAGNPLSWAAELVRHGFSQVHRAVMPR